MWVLSVTQHDIQRRCLLFLIRDEESTIRRVSKQLERADSQLQFLTL